MDGAKYGNAVDRKDKDNNSEGVFWGVSIGSLTHQFLDQVGQNGFHSGPDAADILISLP